MERSGIFVLLACLVMCFEMQQHLFEIDPVTNDADVVYTPDRIAEDMAKTFAFTGIGLEPCMGNGVFLKYLPDGTDWCEIEKGRDFFKYERKVDWIIGNPPYSIFAEWMEHSFKVADDIVYLIPVSKVFTSWPKLREIARFGGIPKVKYYAPGRKIGFPFGFPCGAVHFQRDYTGATVFEFWNT